MARKQRKSKFAIDFKNAGTHDVTMAVINDLLRKYPRGAAGKLGNKNDYTDGWRSNPNEGRTGQYCGYTWEQLWVLLNPYIINSFGYSECRTLIRQHWEKYDEGKSRYTWMPAATCTRRENRLSDRIHTISRYWREKGRKAIYEWKPPYGSNILRDTPFYVWANDMTDARAQVSTVWIPILNATGLAGKDRHGRENVLAAEDGAIKMHTETSDSSMTATTALNTMQALMTKRQEVLDKMSALQQAADQMSSLIEFVSQAAEG